MPNRRQKREASSEKARITEKPDKVVPGLIIRTQPSGRTLYYARYRRPVKDKQTGELKKKQTRTTIGRADHMSLREARKAAKVALSQARLAVNEGLTGERVSDAVAKALLRLDKSPEELEAAAAKQDDCPTVEKFIDEKYGPSLQSRRKYAKNGRETARLKFILGLFKTEPCLDLLSMKVNAIDSGTIDDWLTKRLSTSSERTGKPPSSMTIQRDLVAISGLFKYAITRKLITANPVAQVKYEATANRVVRYLSPKEEERLLAALVAREDRKREQRKSGNEWVRERGGVERPEFPQGQFVDYLRPLVLVALHTGLRRGELLALRWRDVKVPDTKDSAAYIRVPGSKTKNRKAHEIPLNDFAVKVLRLWRSQNAAFDKNKLVFPGKDDKPIYDLRRAWRSVLQQAKITDFRFHDLRHHFASQLVKAGQPLNTVRELLNHADLQMTLRYAHLSPDHKLASVNKLAEDTKKWTI